MLQFSTTTYRQKQLPAAYAYLHNRQRAIYEWGKFNGDASSQQFA